jgi:hypothetical protein
VASKRHGCGRRGLSSAGEREGAARFAGGQGRGARRLAGGEGDARERRNRRESTAAADVGLVKKIKK